MTEQNKTEKVDHLKEVRKFQELSVKDLEALFPDALGGIEPPPGYHFAIHLKPALNEYNIKAVDGYDKPLSDAIEKKEAVMNFTAGPRLGYIVKSGAGKQFKDGFDMPSCDSGDLIMFGTGNYTWFVWKYMVMYVIPDNMVKAVIKPNTVAYNELKETKVSKRNNE